MRGRGRNRKMSMKEMERENGISSCRKYGRESRQKQEYSCVSSPIYLSHFLLKTMKVVKRERKRDGLSYSVFFVSLRLFLSKERIAPYNLKRIHTHPAFLPQRHKGNHLQSFFFLGKNSASNERKSTHLIGKKILHGF